MPLVMTTMQLCRPATCAAGAPHRTLGCVYMSLRKGSAELLLLHGGWPLAAPHRSPDFFLCPSLWGKHTIAGEATASIPTTKSRPADAESADALWQRFVRLWGVAAVWQRHSKTRPVHPDKSAPQVSHG